MIYQGSRYENAVVVPVHSERGWIQTVFRASIGAVGSVTEIVLPVYETLQSLAFDAYGDAELWWRIADANPDLLYPDEIPAGTVVRIPDVITVR